MNRKRKAKKGATLIEAIMSVALIAILIVPLSNVLLAAFKTNKDGEVKQKASFMGQKVLEEMKAYDELKLEKDKSKDYFKLLDGDEVTEDTEDKYIKSLIRDNFRVELTMEKDSNFTYDSSSQNIDNGYDISYKLSQKSSGVEIQKYISEGTEAKPFDSNNLTLKIDGTNNAKILEKGKSNVILEHPATVSLDKGISIQLDDTFLSTLNVEVDSASTGTIYIYIIKDKNCTGSVNVTSVSGNIKVNRYMNLVKGESIADLYNIDVKVYKGTDSKILFQGNTKKNIKFK